MFLYVITFPSLFTMLLPSSSSQADDNWKRYTFTTFRKKKEYFPVKRCDKNDFFPLKYPWMLNWPEKLYMLNCTSYIFSIR